MGVLEDWEGRRATRHLLCEVARLVQPSPPSRDFVQHQAPFSPRMESNGLIVCQVGLALQDEASDATRDLLTQLLLKRCEKGQEERGELGERHVALALDREDNIFRH